MATPRKPDARRGRPPKPKVIVLKRRPGRPVVSLRQHPEKYDVAMFDALGWLFGSERAAAKFMVLRWAGVPVSDDLSYALPPGGVALVAHHADQLRKLARKFTSADDLRWRKAMAEAHVIALTGLWRAEVAELGIRPCSAEAAEHGILQRAALVSEEAFARRVMLTVGGLDHRASVARIIGEFLSQIP
jgi:hypothetical protein